MSDHSLSRIYFYKYHNTPLTVNHEDVTTPSVTYSFTGQGLYECGGVYLSGFMLGKDTFRFGDARILNTLGFSNLNRKNEKVQEKGPRDFVESMCHS